MTIEEDAAYLMKVFSSATFENDAETQSDCESIVMRLVTSAQRLQEAVDVVNRQAEDEMIWFAGQTITEAYLQQALRYLHSVVEGPDSE